MNDENAVMRKVRALVDEYRANCLWFLREDYYSQTPQEALRVLEQIERHGDVAAFRKAVQIRPCLLLTAGAPSAAARCRNASLAVLRPTRLVARSRPNLTR